MGKILIISGVIIILVGIILILLPKNITPGRLPGDIIVERENFKFYFPLTTSIIISIIITLVIFLIAKFR